LNGKYYRPTSEVLKNMLDSISRVTGCEVGLVTNSFDWIQNRVNKNVDCGFCKMIGDSKKGAVICDNLNWRAQIVAVNFKQNYIYKCNFGLIEIVLPIYKENKYLGSLYCGNFFDKPADEKGWKEMTSKLPIDIDKDAIKEEYFEVKYMSAQEIYDLQTVLELIAKSIVDVISNDDHKLSGFDKVLEFIETNFQRDILLDDLAVISSFNPCYVSQLFKKKIGITLTEYVSRIRIKKSKELLINSDMAMSDIAFAVGFKDQNYFSRIFKETEECTPSEYRSKLSKNKKLLTI